MQYEKKTKISINSLCFNANISELEIYFQVQVAHPTNKMWKLNPLPLTEAFIRKKKKHRQDRLKNRRYRFKPISVSYIYIVQCRLFSWLGTASVK